MSEDARRGTLGVSLAGNVGGYTLRKMFQAVQSILLRRCERGLVNEYSVADGVERNEGSSKDWKASCERRHRHENYDVMHKHPKG